MWWRSVFQIEWTASLLPSNATPWERVIEAVDADLVARDPVGLIPAVRSDADSPLTHLPYLAAERSVDEFDGAWPETRQRAVTAGSFRYHQTQATRPALDRALGPLGYSLTVAEWFELSPPGPANTFAVQLQLPDLQPWTAAERERVVRVANRAKAAHTKMVVLAPTRRIPASPLYVGGIPILRRRILIGQQPRVTTLRADGQIWVGGLPRLHRRIIILPRSA